MTENRISERQHVEWTDDYVQVMADWLVGFDEYPEWFQSEVWAMRECFVSSTKAAIRRCLHTGSDR